MLRFKQFLIEKVKDKMNTPMDLADVPEEYDSPEYFYSLDDKFSKFKKGERVDFSPFDAMSLQFGRDKVKERNEYIQKLRDYYEKNPNVRDYVQTPTLSDEHLKERIPFIKFPPQQRASATHRPEIRSFARDAGTNVSPESIERQIKSTQQPEDIKTSSYVVVNPSVYNLNDDEIKSVIGHESWHRLTYPEALKNIKEKEKDLKTPADIAQKYNIDPTFKSITSQMTDMYYKRNKELLDDSLSISNLFWKPIWGFVTGSSEERLKEKQAKSDNLIKYLSTKIPSLEYADIMYDANIASNTKPIRYSLNRAEVPAFMHGLKMELMKKTNQPYRTSDQSDESIDSDADFLMNQKLDPDNTSSFHPSEIKALELLKTPEGKSIWRGVQKTSPKKDNRYA
jgi:hypothetical protein